MREEKLKNGINELLAIEEVSEDSRLTLLEVQKQLNQQTTNQKEAILNLEIYAFLMEHQPNIAKWLNATEMIVRRKIRLRTFSALELQLIITNLLAEQYAIQRMDESEE